MLSKLLMIDRILMIGRTTRKMEKSI